jgi:hypothetical protein
MPEIYAAIPLGSYDPYSNSSSVRGNRSIGVHWNEMDFKIKIIAVLVMFLILISIVLLVIKRL